MRGQAIVLAINGWDPRGWEQRFRALAGNRAVHVFPDALQAADSIAYACAWKPDPGALAKFPNLKAIFSLGAGVDHLLRDPRLPQAPIARIVDPGLTQRMTEYVVLHVLMHHRRVRLYDAQQRACLWRDHDQPPATDVSVGIMGLGVLGQDAIEALKRIGFKLNGWSRTEKNIDGVQTFHGAAGLDLFLAQTEILVVLLPHTPETERILNLALLRKLKRNGALGGAYLINAGRGMLQVNDDIVAALDEGALAGASLDVFPIEPLPKESPLWRHSKITITPHNSASSVPRELVQNVLDQIARFERGEPLQNVIDRKLGY